MAKHLKWFFKRKFEPKVHLNSNSTIITLYDDEELYMKRTSSAEDFTSLSTHLIDVSIFKSHSFSSLAETHGTYHEQEDEMNIPTKVSLLDIDNWIWMEMKNGQAQLNEK